MSYAGTSARITVPSAPRSEPACACRSHEPAPAAKKVAACQCHTHDTVEAAAPLLNGRPVSNRVPTFSDGRPDFASMDVTQRLAYHRHRLGLGR
jgi:hypothetical protein